MRLNAISSLLSGLTLNGFHVAYGAVHINRLSSSHYGSANPQDVAFRRCVLGIGEWFQAQVIKSLESASYKGDETVCLAKTPTGSKIDL